MFMMLINTYIVLLKQNYVNNYLIKTFKSALLPID